MAPKLRFSDGEKVLCFHGPLLYEAKCIKSQTKDKNTKYFIHYSGWNKNWDEWVPESRVLKYNEANMQKQKELEAAHGKGKKTKAIKTGIKKEPTDRESSVLPVNEKTPKVKVKEENPPAENPTKKSRTRLEPNVETEEEYLQKIEIKIKIPDELKHWLVDDYHAINRHKKLFNLPARVTVEKIIEDYVKNRTAVKGVTANKETAINETVNGIREYFNVMLGKQLLYKFERPQYNDIMSENSEKQPSQIYGAMHLLRLFCLRYKDLLLYLNAVLDSVSKLTPDSEDGDVPLLIQELRKRAKIGSALAYTALDEDGISILSLQLYDFLKYLSKSNTPLFSLTDYSAASAEYLKKATLV